MNQLTKKYYLLVMLALSILISSTTLLSQWVSQNSNTNYYLSSVYFLNTETGFVTAVNILEPYDSKLLRTINGGAVWVNQQNFNDFLPQCIQFINDLTGHTAGGFYSSDPPVFYKTTNSGLNWFIIGTYNSPGGVYSIDFLDVSNGYASKSNSVLKTTDSGLNWYPCLSIVPNVSWSSLDFINNNTGWIVTDSGRVYKTTDTGLNWAQANVNTYQNLKDIFFIDSQTGFIVGKNGFISRTTNSGFNWQQLYSGVSSDLISISIPSPNNVFICGNSGLILKTSDNGNNWQVSNTGINEYLGSVFFIDNDTGYCSGINGTILKTTTGGVIGINIISGEVPTEFTLDQNYPNPFNPTTNIKFAIPKAAFVRLAVYDMLGRELESLVNQQLTPGTYEVNWNALKFSSGIYMYRLVTNDFQMVKKMSLIK